MRILLLGADGFIGRHLESALLAAGHTVVRGVRHASRAGDVVIDYRRDLAPDQWRTRLDGIDAVINAVGILNEREAEDFERIHHLAPKALFAACRAAGIGTVVQISALGADSRRTPYLASKADADEALLASCPAGIVVRPALVFGADGASSRFFLMLASLPLLPLPGRGEQVLRPVHVDDLAQLVTKLLGGEPPAPRVIPVVGGATFCWREMIAAYRRLMKLPPAPTLPTPAGIMAIAAGIGDHLPGSLLNRATWTMLASGNSAEVEATRRLLGRLPRRPDEFMTATEAVSARHAALASWRTPLLRFVIAFLWLWSGAVSLLRPATGLALLATVGLDGVLGWAVLAGASTLDIALGVLTLLRPSRRLWIVQCLLILGYSLIIALGLSEQFLHPFAPVVKNLVVLAGLVLLWAEAEET